jgi:hypothetical protein
MPCHAIGPGRSVTREREVAPLQEIGGDVMQRDRDRGNAAVRTHRHMGPPAGLFPGKCEGGTLAQMPPPPDPNPTSLSRQRTRAQRGTGKRRKLLYWSCWAGAANNPTTVAVKDGSRPWSPTL